MHQRRRRRSGHEQEAIEFFENQFGEAGFDPTQWLDIALYYSPAVARGIIELVTADDKSRSNIAEVIADNLEIEQAKTSASSSRRRSSSRLPTACRWTSIWCSTAASAPLTISRPGPTTTPKNRSCVCAKKCCACKANNKRHLRARHPPGRSAPRHLRNSTLKASTFHRLRRFHPRRSLLPRILPPVRRSRAARFACAGIRTRQRLKTRLPPALFGAYAEILIQSAANCQDGLKLAFYLSAD